HFWQGEQIGIIGGPHSHGNRPRHATTILDLDALLAVLLADEHLLSTRMIEGRPGKPRAHRYYLTPVHTIPDWAMSPAEQGGDAAFKVFKHRGPFKKAFNDREAGARVIDFIGTGGQVVCPPAIWTSKDGKTTEQREWEGGEPGEPAVVDFVELWD